MSAPELTVIQRTVLVHISSLGLKQGAHVLDAPCGARPALTLALLEKGFNAIGADVDLEAETFNRTKNLRWLRVRSRSKNASKRAKAPSASF
jgi:cyclopropane fatty-acyl-phospholipid synthase-like methyltransferase